MTDEVYLLAALRIGAGVDPAPLSVSATARAAYALRLPGALTAEPVPLPHPAGARTAAEPRLHRFTAAGLTIDVELTYSEGRVDVAGQVTPSHGHAPPPAPTASHGPAVSPGPTVSPADGGTIVIRTLHDRWVRLPTETGYFAATGLPVGWLSIACHRPGHPAVVTRWLHTRD